jgi:hypothetical protein
VKSGLALSHGADFEGDIQNLEEIGRSKLPGDGNAWLTDIMGAGESKRLMQCPELVKPDQQ